MARVLEFILTDGSLQIPQEDINRACAVALSDDRAIRNADKVGYSVVDRDVNGIEGMPFIRSQLAAGKLVDGKVYLVAMRFSQSADRVVIPTAARSLGPSAGGTQPTPEAGAEDGGTDIPF